MGDETVLSEAHSLKIRPKRVLELEVNVTTHQSFASRWSTWDVQNKIEALIAPREFADLKVTSNVVAGKIPARLTFQGQCATQQDFKDFQEMLDEQKFKVKGSMDVFEVSVANAPAQSQDWSKAFGKDDFGSIPRGIRPDTVLIENLPCRWFSKDDPLKPSLQTVLEVFSHFGKIFRTAIAPETHNSAAGLGLVFSIYIQFAECNSVRELLTAFVGKTVVRGTGREEKEADVRVSLDTSGHMTDDQFKLRKQQREEFLRREKWETEQQAMREKRLKAREEAEKVRREAEERILEEQRIKAEQERLRLEEEQRVKDAELRRQREEAEKIERDRIAKEKEEKRQRKEAKRVQKELERQEQKRREQERIRAEDERRYQEEEQRRQEIDARERKAEEVRRAALRQVDEQQRRQHEAANKMNAKLAEIAARAQAALEANRQLEAERREADMRRTIVETQKAPAIAEPFHSVSEVEPSLSEATEPQVAEAAGEPEPESKHDKVRKMMDDLRRKEMREEMRRVRAVAADQRRAAEETKAPAKAAEQVAVADQLEEDADDIRLRELQLRIRARLGEQKDKGRVEPMVPGTEAPVATVAAVAQQPLTDTSKEELQERIRAKMEELQRKKVLGPTPRVAAAPPAITQPAAPVDPELRMRELQTRIKRVENRHAAIVQQIQQSDAMGPSQ